jgi:chromosome segregation ATPase
MTSLPPCNPPDALAQRVADAVAAETCHLKSQLANLKEENAELRGQLSAARTEIAILSAKLEKRKN